MSQRLDCSCGNNIDVQCSFLDLLLNLFQSKYFVLERLVKKFGNMHVFFRSLI